MATWTQGIQFLESTTQSTAPIDNAIVNSLVDKYKDLHPPPDGRHLWHLVQDVQQQAMVYMNIIDQAKLGENTDTNAAEIKQRFEHLGLVPPGILPNPTLSGLVDKAFEKISKYREILVKITQRYGRQLLNELGFAANVSANVQVDIGFTPSLSLGVVELGVDAQLRP
jgi:hypothetical protein